ncbi:FAD binding domain-containing protein [Diaporthe helianthi]|uniref:FAD binding domain-containing protein n=1 Tax=Diaporthe helianthi TaxID=158607 RepID=A0A2P5HQ85_DIAHE|nr:FAD binding domain-containing protein [Diaporthe helianthi]
MPVPGAQSVQPGVMMSLARLNTRELGQASSIASIGPGQVWQDVYHWLATYGLAVNGGRYPTVGVGGLLVGGGISYFSGKHGWSCDTVVAYEVVLADGSIVEATAAGAHADLFWALRGGHNNFGIVTRFDLKTFPMTSAYYGGTIWDGKNASAQTQFFAALDAYVLPGGGVDDPNAATSAIVSVTPGSGASQLISIRFAPGTDGNPKAFENFTAIDAPVLQSAGGKVVPDWTEVLNSLEQTGDRGSRRLFWSVSFKADSRAIRIGNETVIGLAFSELANVPGAVVALTYQLISKDWLLVSQKSGGNVLDVDPDSGTFISALISCTWDNAADDKKVNLFAKKAASVIIEETTELGLEYDFVYLNDAGPTQKPFETYGGGKSLPRLIQIRNKYDPNRFLQKYLSHGFGIE